MLLVSFGVPTLHSLQKIAPNLFKADGVDGCFTNYSLRAFNEACLFEAHVDE